MCYETGGACDVHTRPSLEEGIDSIDTDVWGRREAHLCGGDGREWLRGVEVEAGDVPPAKGGRPTSEANGNEPTWLFHAEKTFNPSDAKAQVV